MDVVVSRSESAFQSDCETDSLARDLERAKRFLLGGDFRSSFATYCNIVARHAHIRHSLETEFVSSYQQLARQLTSQNETHAAFQLFQDAMSVYADSCLLHNEMGSMLYRMGHCIEALGYFRNALDIDGDFLRARENSDGVCNLLVERWHFRMLNDVERNEAFRCAIERAVRQYGCLNVLDIGCGTGILR